MRPQTTGPSGHVKVREFGLYSFDTNINPGNGNYIIMESGKKALVIKYYCTRSLENYATNAVASLFYLLFKIVSNLSNPYKDSRQKGSWTSGCYRDIYRL